MGGAGNAARWTGELGAVSGGAQLALHPAPPEWLAHRVYRSEADPRMVLVIDEFASEKAFREFAKRVGAEFDRRAGTEGLVWQEEVWTAADAPPFPGA